MHGPGPRQKGLHPFPSKKDGGHQGYVVTLQPMPGVDGIKALRFVLKSALRRHGLKCTDVSLSASYTHPPLEKAEKETSKGLVEGD